MNKWINFVKQWSSEKNVSYKEAMSNPKCKSDYQKHKSIKGDGFINDIARKTSNAIIGKKATRKVENYGHTVINGRNDYPPKVRDLLNKYGNEIINSAQIRRAPVQGAIVSALNVVSLGQFKSRLDNSDYNKLFHLQFFITTQSRTFVIEKNEVINMDINPQTPANTETSPVNPLSQGLTINKLLENTKVYMGGSMFGYSAKDNNCQDFVMGILNGNRIGNEANRTFTKQNTEELFGDSNWLRKISNTVTDIGAKANVITTGAGLYRSFRK